MKPDDPRFTAYALDELSAAERSEVERELREHPEAAFAIEETIEIAQILRRGLKGEPAESLGLQRREAIFNAARVDRSAPVPVNVAPAVLPAPVPASPSPIVVMPRWWHRAGPWQAVAACAMFAFGIYAFLFHGIRPGPLQQGGRIAEHLVVPVPTTGSTVAAGNPGPDLVSPTAKDPAMKIAISNLNAPGAPKPDISTDIPKVDITPGAPEVKQTTAAAEPPPGVPRTRGPRVVGAENPEQANRLAAASVGRATQKFGSANRDAVDGFLRDRLQEAATIQPGNSLEELAQLFTPVSGVPGKFELKQYPSIKVDVEFEPAGQGNAKRIKAVSKPYLEVH